MAASSVVEADVLAPDEGPSGFRGHDTDATMMDPEGRAIPAIFHPLCAIFPAMSQVELDALTADVRANGVRRPIVMLDGMILDGRHRYLAAREAGVGYRTVAFTGADPVAFVLSENLQRRHLNESQRGSVAAKLANMKQGARTDLTPSAHVQKVEGPATPTISRAHAAELLNVSERTVNNAHAVHEKGVPELAEAMDHGLVSARAAADVAALPPERQTEIVTGGAPAVKAAAKEVREEKRVEKWRERVARLMAQADETGVGAIGRVSTQLSVAVHLAIKGRVDVAAMVASEAGVSGAGLSAAVHALTATPEQLARENREVGIVVSAIMSTAVEVEEVRETVRTLDKPVDEPLVGAWRSGWAAAVLCREPGAGLSGDEHAAALEGADAFARRFADFIAVKGER